jgi:hypothetical protein
MTESSNDRTLGSMLICRLTFDMSGMLAGACPLDGGVSRLALYVFFHGNVMLCFRFGPLPMSSTTE